MNIVRIDTYPLSLPFTMKAKAPAWRGRDYAALESLLIRVETDEGIVGWGEAFSYNCQGPVRAALTEMIAPIAMGRNAGNIGGLVYDIQRVLHIYGRSGVVNYALSGLEIALWDIAGKRAGRPLADLLGGTDRHSVPAYASLFRYDDPDSVAAAAGQALADGYGAVKVHTRGTADVKAVRQTVGPDVPLMVDTNCAWTPEQAYAAVQTLKSYGVSWVEEPLYPPEDFQTLSALQTDTGVPLAVGENACTAFEFYKLLSARAARYIQPSITKVGGITEFRKVAALAEVHGAILAPHSPYYGPGFLATLNMIATLPVCADARIEHFLVGLEASIYGDALVLADGAFALPQGPGLGLDPDPDVLRDYLVA